MMNWGGIFLQFSEWIHTVFSSWPLMTVTILILSVVFVNGWTDAPNAIASCVATRAMTPGKAIAMAAIFNFLGLAATMAVNSTVTDTICQMVNFGADRETARIALCAALTAVVLWAVAAWYFGIPTSESHALISGLTGAALAVNGGEGIRFSVWSRILWGLLISVIGGFALGYAVVRFVQRLWSRVPRKKAEKFFLSAQIAGGAANAFLHGSQDGQKFIGVLLLSVMAVSEESVKAPVWMMLLCSCVLLLGTSLGGYRIIRSVGMQMVHLEGYQGFSADLASALCLAFCTANGLPVSTTHVKTSAIMGIGSAKRLRAVHWDVAGQMITAWCLTFPGCGMLGYLAAKLFLILF